MPECDGGFGQEDVSLEIALRMRLTMGFLIDVILSCRLWNGEGY